MKIRFNVTNTFAVIFKILEIAALASIAFRPDIEWGLTVTGEYIINGINTMMPYNIDPIPYSKYSLFMLISLFATFLLFLIGYFSVQRIRS